MHQTGSTATLSQDILDTPFLAERLVGADELDRKARLLRQTLSVGTNLVTHRLGPARVILEEDLVIPQVSLHRLAMADVRK